MLSSRGPAFSLSEQLQVQTDQIVTSLYSTVQMLFYLLPFTQHWATFFGQPVSDQEGACNLGSIRSRKLTAENRRIDEVRADTFFFSVLQEMKGRLATIDLATSFKALVKLAIKVDN